MIGSKVETRVAALEKTAKVTSERDAAFAARLVAVEREVGLLRRAIEISGPGGTLAELRRDLELAEAGAA
jgi:hypothetical protein